MPCDDCSRAEGCPPCVNESSPQAECEVPWHAHTGGPTDRPLDTCKPDPIINNRCKCRHDRFRHCFGKVDGACSKPSCDCEAYVPVTVETVELPEPEGPEYTSCDACGHIEPEHASTTGSCLECACLAWRHALDLAPPQPERRPPLSVAYSVVGGHAYEVSIPGDASVTAEDGALIIKHPSAEILAITRVAPMEG